MDAYLQHRSELVGLAYRITGTMADAEDIAQSTWIQWQGNKDAVEHPRAWLRRVTTNAAVDSVRERKRRPYKGPWLPEPWLTEPWLSAPGLDAPMARGASSSALVDDTTSAEARLIAIETGDIVVLHLMEALSPLQRAAFILRRALECDYSEISEVLGKSESACRQLVSRASRDLEAAGAFERESAEVEMSCFASLVSAVLADDREALGAILDTNCIAISDGGGKRSAALRPIRGLAHVAALLLGLARKSGGATTPRIVTTAGKPGLALYEEGELVSFVRVRTEKGRITDILTLRNPVKLARVQQELAASDAQ